MTESLEIDVQRCVKQTGGATAEGAECPECPSRKMALTHEEVAILGRMRAVKEKARPVAEKLKRLQYVMEQSPQAEAEWKDLSVRLEVLRAQWRDWEKKLEEAVEQKLIILGHRSLQSHPGGLF